MLFYFLTHTFLGLSFGSIQTLNKVAKFNVAMVPKWVWSYGGIIENLTFACCIFAIITTFVKFTIGWALLTSFEVMLGIFIAKLLGSEIRTFISITSFISVPYIMGGLWGWWWIGF
jgi:hypothetical protein